MNTEWSLDVLYKGYEHDAYRKDFEELGSLTNKMEDFAANLTHDKEEETLEQIITYMEEYKLLGNRLAYYLELRESTDTTNSETVNQKNRLHKLLSGSTKAETIFSRYIASVENLEAIAIQNEKLKPYTYFFMEIQRNSKHLLSDKEEVLLSKLDLCAGSAWGNLQSYLTSNLEVEYDGKIITLPEVRNLADSKDREVRKKAYEAELKAYEKIKDSIAFSLNEIKTQVNIVSELRGYESPLAMTLEQSRMKKTTLDAMFTAIKEYLPVFHRYLKHKASLLGYEGGLPWFELFAPMGESDEQFTIESAKDYLVKHFKTFAPDLAAMIEEAFDHDWIDFYPKKGKVGGAFCENLPFAKESRILTNFTGSLSDVVTLAHELGHAYHGMMIQEHLPLNTDYSMPVAETASTFNEAIIMAAAIDDASKEEKAALIESQLKDVTQIICDIYSRFLFESAVFDRCKDSFLFADELEKLMLECQKEAYGDGLDNNYLHPYMWVLKGHYYSSSLSFYNFPYAFGGLFARGLYEKYKEEGNSFLPKYQALLRATTVMDVEDAAKQAEIDLENPEFFRTSLRSYEKLVEDYIALTK